MLKNVYRKIMYFHFQTIILSKYVILFLKNLGVKIVAHPPKDYFK
uniref:Uncharacterized protein n=1 Tax=Anguilla anguilla TaxID=7936 RepID=A0A0E9VHK0_ANGAN